jgi:hypothetical protein
MKHEYGYTIVLAIACGVSALALIAMLVAFGQVG